MDTEKKRRTPSEVARGLAEQIGGARVADTKTAVFLAKCWDSLDTPIYRVNGSGTLVREDPAGGWLWNGAAGICEMREYEVEGLTLEAVEG